MYMIKNALKCIQRSAGRNVLIGLIVFVIAVSACLSLSIQQAAKSAKESALETLSVTATLAIDRQSMMSNMVDQENGFDPSQFQTMFGETSNLSMEEYLVYASASTVSDFYYTQSTSVNGSENLAPVSTSSSNQGFGGRGMEMQSSDFQLIGAGSESALTDFIAGTSTITDGVLFDVTSAELVAVISSELATYNNLAVGDTITITNPNNESETYTLSVVGIYTDSTANQDSAQSMMMAGSDPANVIYMSDPALQSILDASASVSTTITQEETGMTYESALAGTITGTYVFDDVDGYTQFETEVRDLGLDENYTVSSSDIASYENSLVPLNTLSTTAGWFLIVTLVIGAIILGVLNIFNIRERKYEIGVLCAMGMKKGKVATQFVLEIFCITMVAVFLGIGFGALSSVPLTNTLLQNQVAASANQVNQIEENFGRGSMTQMPEGNTNPFTESLTSTNSITEITSAMNLTVVIQMAGIALFLTLASGSASMFFVMRYEPLKILANRD